MADPLQTVMDLSTDIGDMVASIAAVKGKRHATGVLILFNVWQLTKMLPDPTIGTEGFAVIACSVEDLVGEGVKPAELKADLMMLVDKLEAANDKLSKS